MAFLDRAAADKTLVGSYHLPFPGFGHVVREGSAYRWLPADWQWTTYESKMAPYFRPETPLRSARIRSARKAVNDDKRSNIPASGTIPRCPRRVTRNSQLNPYDEGRGS
jgi:hypothetical protein